MGDLFDSTVQLEEHFIQEGVSEGVKCASALSTGTAMASCPTIGRRNSVVCTLEHWPIPFAFAELGGGVACWKVSN